VTGTHYLVADDPRGPWRWRRGRFSTGPSVRRYAARILETDGGLVLLGFRHTAPDGSFIGDIGDPATVSVDGGGWLHLAA
jgi:beta-fructofuranosidase